MAKELGIAYDAKSQECMDILTGAVDVVAKTCLELPSPARLPSDPGLLVAIPLPRLVKPSPLAQ